MVVSQVMSSDIATCTPRMDLETAIQIMLQHNCGFVPVTGPHGRLTGVLTDRDICVALAVHRRTPSHVSVEEAMHRPVHVCVTSDTVIDALGTMSRYRVRRLPVVDRNGKVQGVLSIDDVILATTKRGAATSEDVLETLRVICRRHEPEPVATGGPG